MLIQTRRIELELGRLSIFLRVGRFEMYWNVLDGWRPIIG
jgi:hypothetical protein